MDGRCALPAGYVERHIELAYAETVHAAQGRTVEQSLLLVDGPTDGAAIYVGLTRGREANTAYITTDPEVSPVEVLGEAISRSWVDRPAVEIQAELAAHAQAQQAVLATARRGPSLGL
jgi:ATP-dependent exoDNAse (exonuclease V) alpha subunit